MSTHPENKQKKPCNSQRRRQADKNVIITAVFTKCWTKARPKVRPVNPNGSQTLNCRHRLKRCGFSSERRRSLCRQGDNRGCRWRPERSEGTKRLQPWSSIWTWSLLHAAPSTCLPKCSGSPSNSSWSSSQQVSLQTHYPRKLKRPAIFRASSGDCQQTPSFFSLHVQTCKSGNAFLCW